MNFGTLVHNLFTKLTLVQNKNNQMKLNIRTIIVIGIVIALGLLIINQILDYYFKVDLLLNACDLCRKQGYNCVKQVPIEELLFNITKK